jgi:SAM-dependent methyltransferase
MFRGSKDFRTVAQELRKRGLIDGLRFSRDALRLRVQIAQDERFDRRHGVDTSGYVLLTDIAAENAVRNCSEYHGTPVKFVNRILKALPADLSKFSFVDYGSGKGRILFLAAQLPFKRIIGVEFMKEFHDIAVRNIAAYRDDRAKCRDIQSVCQDARDFELPEGECVLYFYRPFTGPVLDAVLARIEASWRASPRLMYLIFVCPFSSDPFAKLTFVEKIPLRQSLLARIIPEGYGAVLYKTRSTNEADGGAFH